MDIFNHYAENTFAAYPESKQPYPIFEKFLQMSDGFPTGTVKDRKGEVIGFGMLRPYNPVATFSSTSEAILKEPICWGSFFYASRKRCCKFPVLQYIAVHFGAQ